jgi:hypothetical protein
VSNYARLEIDRHKSPRSTEDDVSSSAYFSRDHMPDDARDQEPDLADAEIEKFRAPGVPLRRRGEEATHTDQAFAALHRTMVVGHARMCGALDALAKAIAVVNTKVDRRAAEVKQALERSRR